MSKTSKIAAIYIFALLGNLCKAAPSASCLEMSNDFQKMIDADQALRQQWEYGTAPLSKNQKKLRDLTSIVDHENTRRLKKFVGQCGWPNQIDYAKNAAENAWLIVQHADHDRVFQQNSLSLISKEVVSKRLPPGHLAYLADRIAISEGRPQLYGTQLSIKDECELIFSEYDDESKVDARRAELGWPNLSQYKKLAQKELLPTHCQANLE